MAAAKEDIAATNLAWVEDWTIDAPESEQRSVASRLVKECVAVFRRVAKQLRSVPDVPNRTYRSYEKSFSSLCLWDAGYGVDEGKLDELLAKSRTLRRSILELLISIGTSLTETLIPLISTKQGLPVSISHRSLTEVIMEAKTGLHEGYDDSSGDEDGGSDTSDCTETSSDWEEIAEDISTDVQCLLDLDPIIQAPAPDVIKNDGDKQFEKSAVQWKPHLSYSDKIANRFPHAEAGLVDRFARANWDRFLMTKAARDRHLLESQEEGNNEGTDEIAIGVVAAARSQTEPYSKFHDSGVGTSIRTGSVYAETLMSYRSKGRESVRIPPLPEGAKQGKPFDCVACARQMSCSSNTAWKRHLFQDLCPWICHHVGCDGGNKLFESRTDWIDHLALGHGLGPDWQSFNCPFCLHQTGSGKKAICSHLSAHMEEISLAALPVGIEEDDSEEDDSSSTDGSSQENKRATERLFACPFVKRYPVTQWPLACQHGFEDVHQLKRHLSMHHKESGRCKKCLYEFKEEFDRDDHARVTGCPRDTAQCGYIEKQTMEQIESKKMSQSASEYERWTSIYQTLFPGESVPDPYSTDNLLSASKPSLGLDATESLYVQIGPETSFELAKQSSIQAKLGITHDSCVIRDTSADDSAINRLLKWAAEGPTTYFKNTDLERRECPLLRCRKRFPDLDQMIKHLKSCDQLEYGEYWCYDCERVERFFEAKGLVRDLATPDFSSLAKNAHKAMAEIQDTSQPHIEYRNERLHNMGHNIRSSLQSNHPEVSQQRAADDLRAYLARMHPPISSTDTYEKLRPWLFQVDEFHAVASEESRRAVVHSYINRLHEKEKNTEQTEEGNPSSPFMGSPKETFPYLPTVTALPPDNTVASRMFLLKRTLIHELAVEPRDEKYVQRRSHGISPDYIPTLTSIANYDENQMVWYLRSSYWRQLDVWNYPYPSDNDRQKAIDNCIREYDAKVIPTSDPVWDRLLPMDQRGKGKVMSRMSKFNMPSFRHKGHKILPAPGLDLTQFLSGQQMQRKVDWPESVHSYAARYFEDHKLDPIYHFSEIEEKIKEVIRAAVDDGTLHSQDWDAMPLAQALLHAERE